MSQFIESVENRCLMSVSAVTLMGPTTAGTRWVYQESGGGLPACLNTNTVKGRTSFNGHPVTEIDGIKNLAGNQTRTRSFVTVDNIKGALDYGDILDITSPVTNVHSVQSDSPAAVQLPPSLVAGKAYNFNWTAKIASTTNGHVNPVMTDNVAAAIKLASASTQTVHVGAGTFQAYLVTETITQTINGSRSVTRFQFYFAPNVGAVKMVISPAGASSRTVELMSFKRG